MMAGPTGHSAHLSVGYTFLTPAPLLLITRGGGMGGAGGLGGVGESGGVGGGGVLLLEL